MPQEKRPPDDIWDIPEEIEDWFDKVFGKKENRPDSIYLNINDVEG